MVPDLLFKFQAHGKDRFLGSCTQRNGATLARAFSVFNERRGSFLAVSALIGIPFFLLMLTMNHMLGEVFALMIESSDRSAFDQSATQEQDLTDLTKTLGGLYHKLMVENLFYALFGIFAEATIVLMVAEIYAGGTAELTICAKKAASSFCTIFRAGIIVGLGLMLYYILALLIVLGFFSTGSVFLKVIGFLIAAAAFGILVYVLVAVNLVSPVIVVERKGALEALKRCWTLAEGNRCFLFCSLFAGELIASLVTFLFLLVLRPAPFSAAAALVATLCFMITFPIATILLPVVYFKIRAEQESLNGDVLRRDLEGPEANDTLNGFKDVKAKEQPVFPAEEVV